MSKEADPAAGRSKKRPRMEDVRRILRALGFIWSSAPRWTAAGITLILVQSGVTLAGLYLLKLIVDAVSLGVQADPVTAVGFERVVLLIVLAGVVTIVGALSRSLAGLASQAKAHLVTDHMLGRLHEKSIAVDYAYYEDPRYYNSLYRAQQEAPFRPTRLLDNLTVVVQSSITVAGILVLLAVVHWILPMVVVLASLPALLVKMRHSERLHRWHRERSGTERKANYFGWLIGNADHAKELRIFDLGSELLDRFRELKTQLREETLRLAKARSLADAGAQVAAIVVVFAALGFIGHQTYQGSLTLGDMVMYFGAIQRAQALLQSLFQGLGGLYEDNLFLANVDEFLELEPTVTAPARPQPVPERMRVGLRADRLSFSYPTSHEPVLQDIDFEVGPGELVALVGPNGSGKSTLAKLLCRLYDPTSGAITLDGVDLRDFDPVELRRKFSVVFQDYARYQVSAHDNIWFGNTRRPLTAEEIQEAARAAGVDPAIRRLGLGYDTTLGRFFSGGEELSGGEWQKVAIARAFWSDAEILIVDEPTSALDAFAEAEVVEAIGRLLRNRSALVISHRLSTVRMADRIYFMEAGRVVESGSHSELMELGGKYAKLFRLQALAYHEREPEPPDGLAGFERATGAAASRRPEP